MDKFNPSYILEIQTVGGALLTVTPPFTLDLDITRNTLTSANVCQLRTYNLSEKNRNLIRFNSSDYGLFRAIKLRAGYGKNLPVIFEGNISQAWSMREGVNFITQIECYDGGFAFVNGESSAQFIKGTAQRDVIANLASSLPHLKLGVIGDYPGTLSRANSYSGNTAGILSELTGGGFFVDLGKVNALGTNEYIGNTGQSLLINARSGLLGTPLLEQTIVRFDMLFEPGLNAGEAIRLESITEANFNGQYKVTGVKHRGTISESVAGSVITTGEFFYSKLLEAAS